MYYTNEYTVLMPIDGSPERIIKPGKENAFGRIDGKFKASSYARVLDLKTSKPAMIINVGLVYDGIGIEEVIQEPRKNSRKAKDD